MKLIMTITNAVQGCRDLDTMEMALVFRIILHDSHINEDASDFGAVTAHQKLQVLFTVHVLALYRALGYRDARH